ncbi:hypothetical protein [Curtobacterium sp. UNCCL20]|uniref:hypothetical protein n=1 Tax=Curtobacterium sp. UNCCL20 TaxID=1502773 RepID=UPI00158733CF|nr:hypothetical protein [Curtobacterium sp. UNCCL20]
MTLQVFEDRRTSCEGDLLVLPESDVQRPPDRDGRRQPVRIEHVRSRTVAECVDDGGATGSSRALRARGHEPFREQAIEVLPDGVHVDSESTRNLRTG